MEIQNTLRVIPSKLYHSLKPQLRYLVQMYEIKNKKKQLEKRIFLYCFVSDIHSGLCGEGNINFYHINIDRYDSHRNELEDSTFYYCENLQESLNFLDTLIKRFGVRNEN